MFGGGDRKPLAPKAPHRMNHVIALPGKQRQFTGMPGSGRWFPVVSVRGCRNFDSDNLYPASQPPPHRLDPVDVVGGELLPDQREPGCHALWIPVPMFCPVAAMSRSGPLIGLGLLQSDRHSSIFTYFSRSWWQISLSKLSKDQAP